MAGLLFGVLGAPAGAQVPAGGLFVVAERIVAADVATDRKGHFMVVWTTVGPEVDVLARIYDETGAPLGPSFTVNTYTTYDQGLFFGPRVTSDEAGNFVVVWSENRNHPPVPHHSLLAQGFDPAGGRLGAELVLSSGQDDEGAASIASDPAGNFTVAWWSMPTAPGSRPVIKAQRFAADGTTRGAAFQVDAGTADSVDAPTVAVDGAGRLLMAWTTLAGQTPNVAARRYDANGTPQGGEFLVSVDPGFGPRSAARTDGTIVVAWTVPGSSVLARLYGPDGNPLGAPLLVAAGTGNLYYSASDVVWEGAGGFVVGLDVGQGEPFGVGHAARRFDATGVPRSDVFGTPSGFWDSCGGTAVASDPTGNFVVVTCGSSELLAQRYGGLAAASSLVDAHTSATSNGNGVLEPGEAVAVEPRWRNVNGATQTFAGIGLAFSGPAAPGVSYVLDDAVGGYGSVPNGATAGCSDCYSVGVAFGGTRPATHWDATFDERLTPDALGQHARWPLHIGASFTDVATASPYYRFVEALLHKGVTGGCEAGRYCPSAVVTREQMAVFALTAKQGPLYAPPACTTPVFGDVPASSPTCRFVEELARRGVIAGCGSGDFCPGQGITREVMSVFLLRTLDPAIDPPACTTAPFSDVPTSSIYCRWIAELVRRGVVTGCGGGRFCAGDSVTREQMAVFVAQTFGLELYGF